MRFSSLHDWLRWQEQLHSQSIDLGLERVAEVWQRLSLSLAKSKVITVAGTNGKGSCVAMLDAIYSAAGYSVGTYTSPHLLRYNERIRINGVECDDGVLCRAFETIDQARDDISLSYFEFGTLAALVILAQAQPDVVVLEVGLGGRLDAVNIIDADVALISSIAVDHQAWLGSDRDSIAYEKTGIFRPGQYAICGDPNPPDSVFSQAKSVAVNLLCLGQAFDQDKSVAQQGSVTWQWRGRSITDRTVYLTGLPLPQLSGAVQINNAACVIQILQLLMVELPVAVEAIRSGLQRVDLHGRFQQLFCRPDANQSSMQRPYQCCRVAGSGAVPVILDVAHNPAAAQVLADTLVYDAGLDNNCAGTTIAILGMMADKDVVGFIQPLVSIIDRWYVVELPLSRSCTTAVLKAAFSRLSMATPPVVIGCADIATAAQQALEAAECQTAGRVLVTGSFYTVAGFLELTTT